jgi:hypothetical protein
MAVVRVSHVFRVYQDDDQTSDTWIDIERIDKLVFETGSGLLFERYIFEYDWKSFDSKKAVKKEIKNPSDEKDVVKVPIRRSITLEANGGQTYQKAIHDYANDPENVTRVSHTRQVDHYDLDDSFLDEQGQPPRDPNNYINAVQKDSKEDGGDNPFKVEIIKEFISTSGTGFTWQKHIWSLDSDKDELLQFGNKDWLGSFGSDSSHMSDIDPPWRLDPLQNIINISWGDSLAVEFGDQDQDAPGYVAPKDQAEAP